MQSEGDQGTVPVNQTLKRADSLFLLNAIHKGDVDAVRDFYTRNPLAKNAITEGNSPTILQSAIFAGQSNIVEALVEIMSEEIETAYNSQGKALAVAAVCGMTEIVKCLVRYDQKLLTGTDAVGCIPLVSASLGGHKELTYELYAVTPFGVLRPENGNHGSCLLIGCLRTKTFDIMFDVLHRCPSIINGCWKELLDGFAMTPAAFVTGSRLTFWQQCIYDRLKVSIPSVYTSSCGVPVNQQEGNFEKKTAIIPGGLYRLGSILLQLFGINQIYNQKWNHAYARASLHFCCQHISTFEQGEINGKAINEAISVAIKNSIVDFLIEITETNPDMLTICSSDTGASILMAAIAFRQEKIARFINGLPIAKILIGLPDVEENNVLHIAGKLAPDYQLARISGAALQMQREVQWFKEVDSIVTDHERDCPNKYGETPYQVFTREHKVLQEKAEESMKETASSYTVVGALIITIMFAAAFTSPGGYNQNTGYPMFKDEVSFAIYIISDAVSLFAASASVLMFLGILTSRYNIEDFRKSLPRKLIIGLSTLFISIATMMIAFCSALFLLLPGRWLLIIPTMLLAGIPVSLFVWLQFPFLVEIYILTYRSPIFGEKRSLASKIKACFTRKKKIL
ncbi:hypothetical protein SLE2022_370090 [Rubroshorea leprosula]